MGKNDSLTSSQYMEQDASVIQMIHSALCSQEARKNSDKVGKVAIAYIVIEDERHQHVSISSIADYIGEVSIGQIFRAIHAIYTGRPVSRNGRPPILELEEAECVDMIF